MINKACYNKSHKNKDITMALQSYARPTPANLRCRLRRIQDTAQSLDLMATAWNPKGRYYVPQREMIRFAQAADAEARRLLGILSR